MVENPVGVKLLGMVFLLGLSVNKNFILAENIFML